MTEYYLPAVFQSDEPPLVPAATLVRFKNNALSVSRLKRWEACKRAFRFQYVDKFAPGEQALAPMFGTLLHSTLEALFAWVVREEYSGRIPEDKLLEYYREAWTASGLTGVELYTEGLVLLRGYLREHPEVDHFQILAVEQGFEIQLEEFTLRGFIDRVDRVSDDEIEIIDYKSNRLLFSREEVSTDLQVSAYALAARELWPWATKVRFKFHMLRHSSVLETERTAEQLEDARSYVLAAGRQTESETEFPATLNPNCPYCDHRARCEAYQDALAQDQLGSVRLGPGAALDDVARARERCAAIIKILDGRKRELEAVLRAELVQHGTVTAGGVAYRLDSWNATTTYPVEQVLAVLDRLTTEEGLPAFDPGEVRRTVLSVDGKALVKFLAEAVSRVPRAPLMMAQLEVESLKVTTPGAPRLHATTLKGMAKPEKIEKPQAAPALPVVFEVSAPPGTLVPQTGFEVTHSMPELTAEAGAGRVEEWSKATVGGVAIPGPVLSHKTPLAALDAYRDDAPVPAATTATSSRPTSSSATTATASTTPVVVPIPIGPGPTPGWTGRAKRKRSPTKCPCGWEGYAKAITAHRLVCDKMPPPKAGKSEAEPDDEHADKIAGEQLATSLEGGAL